MSPRVQVRQEYRLLAREIDGLEGDMARTVIDPRSTFDVAIRVDRPDTNLAVDRAEFVIDLSVRCQALFVSFETLQRVVRNRASRVTGERP